MRRSWSLAGGGGGLGGGGWGGGGGGEGELTLCFVLKKRNLLPKDCKWFYASCDCLIMYFFSYQVGDGCVPAIPRLSFSGSILIKS